MSNFSKGLLVIIVLLILVLGLSFWAKNSAPASPDNSAVETGPIKIGLSLPLTGDLAFIGEAGRNAAILAFEEINSDANNKYQYQAVIEDDSFDAAKAAGVIQKFIGIDKVSAVISIGSTAGNAVAPLTEINKIPHIGVASDPVIAKGDFNFINWTRPQEEVLKMIEELQKRKLTKVSILGVNQQGFRAIVDDFKEKAKTAGITVIIDEVFNPGQTDFRTTLSKLETQKPQIYLLGAFDPEIGIIIKQMQDLGIKTPTTSIESFGLTSDPKPFEGLWYVDSTVPTSGFNDKYVNEYGKAPGPTAANVYDSVHLLVGAFESAGMDGKPSGEQVVVALNNITNYDGALGHLSAGPDGAFISEASVKVIKNGEAVAQ